MATNELAYFTDSVNSLMEGKLILVDKHIATLLKCVATSQTLCKCLAETVKTMYYPTELSRAKVSWTNSIGVVESRLKLPADRDRLFAFVVCLLTEIDSGRRNFIDFLKEFYNATDNDQSYAMFVREVLQPFKRAGESLLRNVDPQSLSMEFAEQAENFFKAERIYIETTFLQRIFAKMDNIRTSLITVINKQQQDEFLCASEYLVNAFYLKNPKIIKICLLAYSAIVAKYPFAENKLKELSDLTEQIQL